MVFHEEDALGTCPTPRRRRSKCNYSATVSITDLRQQLWRIVEQVSHTHTRDTDRVRDKRGILLFFDINDELFPLQYRKYRDILRENHPYASHNVNSILNVIQCNYTEIGITMEYLF